MDKETTIKEIRKLKGKNNGIKLLNFWNNLDLELRKDVDVVASILATNNHHDEVLEKKVLNGSGVYSDSKFYQKLLKNNRKFSPVVREKIAVIEDVKRNGLNLKKYPTYFNDRDVVRYAVHENGLALKYASYIFKDDYITVNTAVHENGLALEYASCDLRNDKGIILSALKNNPKAYIFLGDNYTRFDDLDVMLLAIKGDPNLLGYVAQELRDNPKLTRTAIETSGLALKYAATIYQNDPGYVKIALMQNKSAIKYVGDRLLHDEEIMSLAKNTPVKAKTKILKR